MSNKPSGRSREHKKCWLTRWVQVQLAKNYVVEVASLNICLTKIEEDEIKAHTQRNK